MTGDKVVSTESEVTSEGRPGPTLTPIAVDAMGGDHGPSVVVDGAVAAAKEFSVPSVLVGDKALIEPHLQRLDPGSELPVTIHHASQAIGMDESPGLALKGKPDASIRVAFELVAAGKASAVVSSGNTGAIMAAGVFVGGTLPGIARPAIASLIPKAHSDRPTVLLDSGANTGCQAFQLVQFAVMGHYYAVSVLGCANPRVALLSNGTEMTKGNDIIRSAAIMLSDLEGINFIGFVEGRDMGRDVVDVVVCDGFVGNIVLKAMEGSAALVFDSIKRAAENNLLAKLGMWMAKPTLKAMFQEKLDPASYGGAPLLGLGQVAIKCHGSSSGRAVKNGIRVAHTFARDGVLANLHAALAQLDVKAASMSGDETNATGWSRVFEKSKAGRGRKSVTPGQSAGGSDGRE